MSIDMSITCNVCLKSYKTRTTFNRHVCKAIDNSTICKFCNKEFKTKYNRKNHEIKCNETHSQTLLEENEKLKMIIKELESNKTDQPMKVTNITNNGNITNNTIIINNLGNEDISHITQKQMIRLLRMNKECPVEMIKMIHFNSEKPENHNVYKPNFKDKYVKYCDNNIWKIGDLMKIVTELYLSKMDIAEEKFDELKQFLEDSKKNRFQQLLDNREEPEIMGGILKRIIEILYNEKSVITDKLK